MELSLEHHNSEKQKCHSNGNDLHENAVCINDKLHDGLWVINIVFN